MSSTITIHCDWKECTNADAYPNAKGFEKLIVGFVPVEEFATAKDMDVVDVRSVVDLCPRHCAILREMLGFRQ